MKFTNGYWLTRPEITPFYAIEYEATGFATES